jgi:hypothetical protein
MRRFDSAAPRFGLRAAFACALAAAWLIGAGAAPVGAQDAAPLPSYRVFLNDGTPLVSYGEFSRSNGRVVFTMPLGTVARPDALQVVTLPESLVDWERTNRYTEAVRHRRYAATQGEADYLALGNMVARALSDMAFAPDAAAKVRIGEEIRRRLQAWPSEHFGYRAADVRDLVAIVEESLSDVRAGAGEHAFDLNLVATVESPVEPLLPEPTLEQAMSLAATAAEKADSPHERVSLQSAILVALGQRRARAPEPWMGTAERRAKQSLAFEARVDRQYADLARRTREAARTSATRGDVRAIERLEQGVRQKHEALARRRPDRIAVLLGELSAALDTARNNRLALDRWQYRLQIFAGYKRATESAISSVAGHASDIEAVRKLAGPDPKRLDRTDRRLAELEISMLPVAPPPDLTDAHEAFMASIRLLREAVRLRREALAAGSMDLAYNASSAAAGGWLIFERVRMSIADYFRRPSPL